MSWFRRKKKQRGPDVCDKFISWTLDHCVLIKNHEGSCWDCMDVKLNDDVDLKYRGRPKFGYKPNLEFGFGLSWMLVTRGGDSENVGLIYFGPPQTISLNFDRQRVARFRPYETTRLTNWVIA